MCYVSCRVCDIESEMLMSNLWWGAGRGGRGRAGPGIVKFSKLLKVLIIKFFEIASVNC